LYSFIVAWAKYKEVRLYRVNDTLSSLSLGVLSLLTKKLAAKAVPMPPPHPSDLVMLLC
jgi:hypothetical protein